MTDFKVLVAHLGARKHYQEPILLHQWGMLDRFYTDFYSGNSQLANFLRKSEIYRYLPKYVKKGLDRYDAALDRATIVQFPDLAYRYVSELKRALPEERSKVHIKIAQEFCHRIVKNGIGDIHAVYGYDGASLELFEYAKSRGIRCILDQTVAERSLIHQLLLQEEDRWKGWSKSPFTVSSYDLKLAQRQSQEQELADCIICGSSFVKDSLVDRGVGSEKIFALPLGQCKDKIQRWRMQSKKRSPGDKLKILFVGSVGLRKGIPYLLEALHQLKNKIPFTCKIVGNIEISSDKVEDYGDICEFVGLLPRSQMKFLYDWADLFVLPSICEGSAMVTYEAMSWRLPIVTTYNSGSLVRDEVDGYIVPIRSIDAIAQRIVNIYDGKHKFSEQESWSYLMRYQSESREQLRQRLCNVSTQIN